MFRILLFVVLLASTDGFVRYRKLLPTLQRCTNSYNQVPRSEIPSRFDTCKVLISGVVGTEPKEIYMKNGHYVVNFALAVVGHFRAVHEQEMYKPTETMWMSMEMWDGLAKSKYDEIKKGRPIRGVGQLILNKWLDKETGEERKMYKIRLTKALSLEEFNTVNEFMDDGDNIERMPLRGGTDSGFSTEFPEVDDQTGATKTKSQSTARSEITGYTYRHKPVVQHDRHKVAASPPQHTQELTSSKLPSSQPLRDSGSPLEHPEQNISPAIGSGAVNSRQVWNSLLSEYPGMIKPANTNSTGPQWG